MKKKKEKNREGFFEETSTGWNIVYAKRNEGGLAKTHRWQGVYRFCSDVCGACVRGGKDRRIRPSWSIVPWLPEIRHEIKFDGMWVAVSSYGDVHVDAWRRERASTSTNLPCEAFCAPTVDQFFRSKESFDISLKIIMIFESFLARWQPDIVAWKLPIRSNLASVGTRRNRIPSGVGQFNWNWCSLLVL